MKETALTTMYAWLLAAPLLFAFLPVGSALIVNFLVGWCFLPIVVIDAPWLDLDKSMVVSLTALLGIAAFGRRQRPQFQISWCDVPMLVWCVVPFATSIVNDLGPYDGTATAAAILLTWGVPYLLARAYLPWERAPHDVAVGIVAGGLVYAPLCALEAMISPQLHNFVYGYHQHGFEQTIRGAGSFRPMVFMNHGLMVGMWMTCATLTAFVLWRSGSKRALLGIPMGSAALILLGTAVLCKSGGALILLGVGFAAYGLSLWLGRWPMYALFVSPVIFVSVRVSGLWNAEQLVELARRFSLERAGSLQYRIDMERRLLVRAWEHPLLGWGGYGRMFPPDLRPEESAAISDSLWVIVLGMNGFVGLACVMLVCAIPLLALGRKFSGRSFHRSDLAPAAVLALCLILFLIDGMVNMMVNPVYLLAAGATTSFALAARAPTQPIADPNDVQDAAGAAA